MDVVAGLLVLMMVARVQGAWRPAVRAGSRATNVFSGADMAIELSGWFADDELGVLDVRAWWVVESGDWSLGFGEVM